MKLPQKNFQKNPLKKWRRHIINFLAIFFCPLPALSSAWNPPQGQFNSISSFYYSNINSYFDRSGDKKPQSNFIKFEYKPYIEYGYDDDISLGISPSFQIVESEGLVDFYDSNYGLVFAEIFLKKNLLKKDNNVLSYEVVSEVPGFYSSGETPTFGKKDFFAAGRISYGYGLEQFFFNADSAIRSRVHDTVDTELGMQSISSVKTGYKYKNWQFIGGVSYTKSMTGYTSFTNTNRYGFDVMRGEISIAKNFGDFSISLGTSKDILGVNVGKSETAIISISKRF